MNYVVTFLGLPMSQEWIDIHIWEQFFSSYPVKTFVELGTGHGGLSLYFALQCAQRGVEFHTIDHQQWADFECRVPKMLNLSENYHLVDIFSETGQAQISQIIQNSPKPLAMFFDNGNKPREWKLFAPALSPGDFCIVHDWETEFFPQDIGDVRVERILADLADSRPNGWKAMWFKRIP